MRWRALWLGLWAALTLTALFQPGPDRAHIAPAATGAPAPAPVRTDAGGDAALYRAIIGAVAKGQPYHASAAQQQRAHGYPLRPFVTMRLPTLAYVSAALGPHGLIIIAWGLLGAILLAWLRALRELVSLERALALALIVVSAVPMLAPAPLFFHDVWAGLLIALALACWRKGQWHCRLLASAAAATVRELAAPFAGLVGLVALIDRDRRAITAALAVGAALTALLVWHRAEVLAVTLANDLGSPGWSGARGPRGLIDDLRTISLLGALPAALAAPIGFAPLLGWSAFPPRLALMAGAWFAGLGTMIMVFARPDNLYWSAMLLPAWFIGLAGVPRFAGVTRRAMGQARA